MSSRSSSSTCNRNCNRHDTLHGNSNSISRSRQRFLRNQAALKPTSSPNNVRYSLLDDVLPQSGGGVRCDFLDLSFGLFVDRKGLCISIAT